MLRAERNAEIIRLRREGMSVADIARRFGIGISSVSKIWTKALANVGLEEVELARQEQSARLDELSREAWAVLHRSKGGVEDQLVLNAIHAILKVEERRAKLLGLDAPERTEITVEQVRYELVGVDASRLTELLTSASPLAATQTPEIARSVPQPGSGLLGAAEPLVDAEVVPCLE